MGYKKIIRYGNSMELYEYEKHPDTLGRRRGNRRGRKNISGDKSLGTDGEKVVCRQEELGKRQDNARSVSVVFRRLVSSNLSGSELPLLITFTYKENMSDISVGYKDYRSFIQNLRYKFGKDFKYICVPEFQKRGAVHFHALFWVLPSETCVRERHTRDIARLWGKGFVDMMLTDGNEKISGYLAKYMSKAFIDPRLKNQKAYTTSRNISRPTIEKGDYAFWPIIDEFALNNPPIFDKEYWTKWLGTCRYRHYKISNDKP